MGDSEKPKKRYAKQPHTKATPQRHLDENWFCELSEIAETGPWFAVEEMGKGPGLYQNQRLRLSNQFKLLVHVKRFFDARMKKLGKEGLSWNTIGKILERQYDLEVPKEQQVYKRKFSRTWKVRQRSSTGVKRS